MKHLTPARWLATCLVLCTAIGAAFLPPRVTERGRFVRSSTSAGPNEAAARRLLARATRTNDRMKRLVWLDEMRGAIPLRSAAGSSVILALPEDVPVSVGEQFESTLLEAVDLLAPSGTPVRVGFRLVDANLHGHPELLGRGRQNSTEYYVGEDAAGAYCFAVRARPDRTDDDRETGNRWLEARTADAKLLAQTLGPCSVYARFGSPGAQVQEWMEGGGFGFAWPVFATDYPADGTVPFRRAFGRLNGQGVELPLQVCAVGDAVMCERLFTHPNNRDPWVESAVGGRGVPVATFSGSGRSRWIQIQLLGWARQEFGDDAFQQFWQSDLPVVEAFEDAFPVTLAEWIQGWVGKRTGQSVLQPVLSVADAGGSIAFMLLCLGLTIGFTRRRALPGLGGRKGGASIDRGAG